MFVDYCKVFGKILIIDFFEKMILYKKKKQSVNKE